MKTFKEFCQEVHQLDEFINVGKASKVAGPALGVLGGEAIKKVAKNPIVDKLVNMGTAGIGMGRFTLPAIGAAVGSEVLAPAAIKLAQQRRQAQQQRLNQLVPSGRTDVSGKPAQIRPLNR